VSNNELQLYKKLHIKNFVNKKVFSFFLKELVSLRERTLLGRWCHALGAATRNARSPNRSLVREVNRVFVVADRRTVCRDVSAATGRRRSVMYTGALQARAWCTNRHSLY